MLSKKGCEKALARIVNDDYYFENDPYGEDKASAFDKDVDMIEQLIDEHFEVLDAIKRIIDKAVLSTNDYTTAEKQKLGAIASGAQVNVIEKVSVNGSQVSSAITKAVEGIASGFKYSVVDALPQTGKSDTIYLKANSGSGQNILTVTD